MADAGLVESPEKGISIEGWVFYEVLGEALINLDTLNLGGDAFPPQLFARLPRLTEEQRRVYCSQ